MANEERKDGDRLMQYGDAFEAIAMEVATRMVENDPEKVVASIDKIMTAARVVGVKLDDLSPAELDSTIGAIYYYIGVRLSEASPDLRNAIVRHMRTCTDHTVHKLQAVIGLGPVTFKETVH